VVSATAVRASHGKLVDVDARFYQFARRAYGLGWYHGDYEGELLMHDFGNYPGFRAHVSFMPAHGIGVAVLANESAQGYFMPEAIATLIYDRLLGKPDLAARRDSVVTFLRADAENVRQSIARDQARRAARPDTLAFPLSAYTGTFVEPEAGTMRITASGTTLRASIGVLTGEMEPVDGQTQLRVELVPGSGDLVDFFISSGRADSLTYGGRNFRRTDGPR
jgi:CubicO group peptidase (beta-lactamase class C family)